MMINRSPISVNHRRQLILQFAHCASFSLVSLWSIASRSWSMAWEMCLIKRTKMCHGPPAHHKSSLQLGVLRRVYIYITVPHPPELGPLQFKLKDDENVLLKSPQTHVLTIMHLKIGPNRKSDLEHLKQNTIYDAIRTIFVDLFILRWLNTTS